MTIVLVFVVKVVVVMIMIALVEVIKMVAEEAAIDWQSG